MRRIKTILIVEHDQTIRKCVTQALEVDGYRVLGASDGAEALALVEQQIQDPVSLVLLDVCLPIGDGWQFADGYRRLPGPHAPIIVVTSHASVEAAGRAEQIKAVAFLTKPFDIGTLLAVVAQSVHPGPRVRTAPLSPVASARTVQRESRALVRASDDRQRQLMRLRSEVTRVREALALVQGETRQLAEIEANRRLTPGEAKRAAAIRRESQGLGLELELFRREFLRLREEAAHATAGMPVIDAMPARATRPQRGARRPPALITAS